MTIQLVKVVRNGQMVLVGQRASDRWNLAMLGIKAIPYNRNGAALKRLRRCWSDFVLSVKQGEIQPITSEERAMFLPTAKANRIAA